MAPVDGGAETVEGVVVRPLLSQALALSLKAYGEHPEDAVLVRIAEVEAATIDSMEPPVAAMMMPQHAGLLMRALTELDKRAARRGRAGNGGRRPPVSRLEAMRAARAAGGGGKGAR